MIVVRRLNKTVVRQLPKFTVRDELAEGRKNFRLMGQKIHDFHRGALLIVVIDLGRTASIDHAAINAFDVLTDIENVHANLAEGSPVVGEGSVADCRSRNRGEPVIE